MNLHIWRNDSGAKRHWRQIETMGVSDWLSLLMIFALVGIILG